MYDQKFLSLIKDYEKDFSGWDFSYITDTGRIGSELLTWSYGSIVNHHIPKANSLLDMGTGGGELLSKLHPLPELTFATEGYKPNVTIAKSRLEPLGIKVFEIEKDDRLPFKTSQFDLIINKHESYSPKEVRRVLAKGGIFITQQVGGLNSSHINEQLEAPLNSEFVDWNLRFALDEIKKEGFEILDKKEEYPVERFYDLGALIYYLKAIPWQVPDFEMDHYIKQLYIIHQTIERDGYFDVKQHRFLITAKAI
ncbi:class I SAM-dependent methyltransferase [Aquibacillus rhizosphaerae]|uniref:Methyltransferase domain-containing protein n=1 Tax=Aquibacillus rhizosphaerae TaxID=3051431 RepID=A0ABT7LA49_9BACI|nr:methyltransferase domain-containing protein [Aquibacillus sp. LR5S19]MDL4842122.1 methyltransferase domain-containing protein [Aquibacillus sp. LR5S19]